MSKHNRKAFSYILPVLVLLATACNSGKSTTKGAVPGQSATVATPAQKPWAVRMADSEMQRAPQAWMVDFNPKPKWDYTPGLFATSLERLWKQTGDKRYYTYIKAFADTMITDDGTIKTYNKSDYNIDRVNSGKFLFGLYQQSGQQKYKTAIETLRDQLHSQPRTSEGGFWHKKVYPHQMWLDGLYMGSPFLAQYAATFHEPQLFNDVANQIILVDKHTWDAEKSLWRHGWDESRQQKWADPETGQAPNVWGRAMGWYAMALVDVLDYLPENHPQRPQILEITKRMAKAIAQYQDADSGVWWQVVDQGGREGNYLESSASTMFVYFLAKAAQQGYIDQNYLGTARKGYEGILKNFIREEPDGTISITNVCAVAGLGGNPYRDGSYEYYIHEPQRDNDPKAVGPFIMASLQLPELNNNASLPN